MRDLIENKARILLGDVPIQSPILGIAIDYIISFASGYLGGFLPPISLIPVVRAVVSEYENMVKEDRDLKTYAAGDITLTFSDTNLVGHLQALEKDLVPYRKIRW